MQIQWKGHSCFLFTGANGVRVLTDPFNEKVGYPLPDVEADVVTVSHQHFDHNSVNLLPGQPVVVENPGDWQVSGVKIHGVETFHDGEQGTKRGKNTVFVIKLDGLTVCHLGDLGHILSPEQVAEIGPVDVLCIPVGGFYTIDARQAHEVVGQLKPAVVLPMHYKFDESVALPIAEAADFVQFYPEAERQEVLDLGPNGRGTRVVILALT